MRDVRNGIRDAKNGIRNMRYEISWIPNRGSRISYRELRIPKLASCHAVTTEKDTTMKTTNMKTKTILAAALVCALARMNARLVGTGELR